MASTDSQVVVVGGGLPPKIVWQLELLVGLVTLALGVVLALHPSTSLNVICVFLGVLLVIGGIFHFVRALDRDEEHRAWVAIAGLLELVIGVVMIRHLHLTQAVIGLLIGLTWIVQGVVALLAGAMSDVRGSRGWVIAFGVISLIAGIVVVSVPQGSLTTLATLLGIWFIVMGVLELIGGFVLRSALHKAGA
jgi:uncharacterized membrane protein HdeD (DUF308 family)